MRGVLTAAALLLASAGAASASSAAEPDAAAWWTAGPLGLGAGIGVGSEQLVVDGLSEREEGWRAVAGLSFALEHPLAEAAITLNVSSRTPSARLAACRITAPFEPSRGGPPEAVPEHDCSAPIVAETSEDGMLVLAGVEGFAAGDHLRVLLVPAGPGRIILEVPGGTLTATSGTGAPKSPIPQETAPFPGMGVDPLGPAASSPEHAAPPASVAGERAASGPGEADMQPADTFPRSSPFRRTDVSGAPLATAMVLLLTLGAFTALHRGSFTRLRPARTRWMAD